MHWAVQCLWWTVIEAHILHIFLIIFNLSFFLLDMITFFVWYYIAYILQVVTTWYIMQHRNNSVTRLIVLSNLLQVVKKLFQTCCDILETRIANTTCLQFCKNLCIFTRVVYSLLSSLSTELHPSKNRILLLIFEVNLWNSCNLYLWQVCRSCKENQKQSGGEWKSDGQID